MPAPNISKVTSTIRIKDSLEGICFRMIFLSEPDQQDANHQKWCQQAIDDSCPIEGFDWIDVKEIKQDPNRSGENDNRKKIRVRL